MTIKVLSVHVPEVKVVRGAGGDLDIFLDDFCFVSIHYDYRHTSNSDQYSLAEHILARYGLQDPNHKRIEQEEMSDYRLVPLEPTDDMIKAGLLVKWLPEDKWGPRVADIYRAMIQAAPELSRKKP